MPYFSRLQNPIIILDLTQGTAATQHDDFQVPDDITFYSIGQSFGVRNYS